MASSNQAYVGMGDSYLEKETGLGCPRNRLSTIWFDEIFSDFATFGDELPRALNYLVDRGKLQPGNADELVKIWRPVPDKFRSELDEDLSHEQAEIQKAVSLVDFESLTDDWTHSVVFETSTGSSIDVASQLIAQSIGEWSRMQAEQPITYVSSPATNAVLTRLHRSNDVLQEYEAFFKIFSLRVPDYGTFGWDEIVEIRNNRRIAEFRNLVRDVHNNSDDLQMVQEIFEEIERDTLVAIAKETKPKLTKTVSYSVLGNLPSPIILNPFGIFSAVEGVRSEMDRDKKFSWLYFLLETSD